MFNWLRSFIETFSADKISFINSFPLKSPLDRVCIICIDLIMVSVKIKRCLSLGDDMNRS